MEIKNRLFPYPVLCGETDDYGPHTEFALEPKLVDSRHELILKYDFVVKCDSLETLIRKGQVGYVLHIECSTTSFRVALKSDVPYIEYRLPKSRVSGEINLVAMLVAKVNIDQYANDDLNEDYAGESIAFKKGAILAYQNLPPVYVSKKTEDLANNESFFSVVKQPGLDPDEIKPLSFNLVGDKIQILVDERTYDSFIQYQHSQHIAMSLLVLPAIAYMITEVSEDPDSYARYPWFQRLEKFYRAEGKDFVEDVLHKDDNPINIAQEMLQNPISKAYRELFVLEG